jgi:sodium-dependent dicarboxylate transporter 2/3/5
MFELLPLPVTALIPVAVFPLFGIMSTNEVSMCYMKDTCMLYLGGKIFLATTFMLKAHEH